MKFSCTQENLHQGLAAVSHIANRNINLPILGNVLIKIENGVLRFMTTNLEIAVRCVVRGKIENQGEFTVPSKLFSDYVSLLPNERVDVIQEGNSLTVSCGQYRTKLHGIVASEFPLVPSIEQKQKFSVKVDELRKAIGQVLFAVAPNESRPEISGVLFKFTPADGGSKLILAATDSYRLSEKNIPMSDASTSSLKEPVSVIVPARTVAELVRILGVFRDAIDNPQEIDIVLGENQILFSYNSVELISRTIEGKYPDYQQLIPERFETEVMLSRNELMRAVKTTSLFSRSGLNDVHLRFSPEKSIHVSAMNTQTGEHMVEVDGTVRGKENTVTVNYKYFLDGVGTIESDDVAINLIDGVSPCVIRPHQEGSSNDFLYIVMPIRQ